MDTARRGGVDEEEEEERGGSVLSDDVALEVDGMAGSARAARVRANQARLRAVARFAGTIGHVSSAAPAMRAKRRLVRESSNVVRRGLFPAALRARVTPPSAPAAHSRSTRMDRCRARMMVRLRAKGQQGRRRITQPPPDRESR